MPPLAIRQWIYGVVVAGLAVAVIYKVVDTGAVAAWTFFAASALGVAGSGQALLASQKQKKTGEVDPR